MFVCKNLDDSKCYLLYSQIHSKAERILIDIYGTLIPFLIIHKVEIPELIGTMFVASLQRDDHDPSRFGVLSLPIHDLK